MNWMGIGFLVALVAVVGYLMWYNHRSKGTSGWRIDVAGFALVGVTKWYTHDDGYPEKVSKAAATTLARDAYRVQRAVWKKCDTEYHATHRMLNPIDKVLFVDGEVEPEHPVVVWHAPIPTMKVRYDAGWEKHLAGEYHNAYRYALHGIDNIYETIDAQDAHAAHVVARAIEKRWGARGSE